MGWGYTGPDGEEHEGYAAFITRDGRSSSTSNASGALFESARTRQAVDDADAAGRTPTSNEMYDLVPWDELLGWHTTCSCGWTGSTWERAATLRGEHGGQAAHNGELPDGSTVADAAYAQWRRHLERIKWLAEVRGAARAAADARRWLDDAVAGARGADPAATWAEIGAATGMSRQSAHERWGRPRQG